MTTVSPRGRNGSGTTTRPRPGAIARASRSLSVATKSPRAAMTGAALHVNVQLCCVAVRGRRAGGERMTGAHDRDQRLGEQVNDFDLRFSRPATAESTP
ncbi:hypothetical protein [Cupriavidus sp. YAF13]|uniref:hypothetical protein n=1 Tax=Cupriavidus sp. YAF13 TaxID=3233075 RepID=UPI003F8DB37E